MAEDPLRRNTSDSQVTDETRTGSGDTEAPFVSIIIPCRNEARYIEACLRGILAQDYPPDRMEIIVADGMSVDGTMQTVGALAVEDGCTCFQATRSVVTEQGA